MLRWEKDMNGYTGQWMGGYLGFDDDCLSYRVKQDEGGWYFEEVQDQDGMDGYDTAQEAMEAAEADFQTHQKNYDEEDEPLSYEEAMEVLGDILYEARRDDPDLF